MAKRKHPPVALSRKVAEIVKFIRLTNKFRNVKRLIWYKGNDERERNGEHTFQLAFVAWFIQQRHLPHLDLLKVILYATVHDLPEVYADDTPAFVDKSGTYQTTVTRKDKKEREKRAINRISNEWNGPFPSLLQYIQAYEAHADEESRFVNALDKFLAELNIFEDEGRTDKELGLTLEEKIAYKRSRIAVHPLMLELYDAFCEYCRHRPDLFFSPAPAAAE